MSLPEKQTELVPSPAGEFFDYSSVVGFEKSYIAQFYGDRAVSNDEAAVINFLIPRLRQFSTSTQGLSTYLEIGCGPTVHHAILVAPHVKRMHLSEFLESNRTEVDRWIDQPREAVDWQQYTRFILEAEGNSVTTENVRDRESQTRQKIECVIPGNLMLTPIVSTGVLYDLVGCFYCLEEVARTPDAFRAMIANVATVVRVGGTLMISALRGTSFYHVQGTNGEEVEFPCLALTESLVRQSLLDAGFEIAPDDVFSCEVDGQAEEGVPGVILAFVTKRT
jgi:hypothetical protein